ncbi:MAG: hypothetical protein LBQ75_09915 [Zoogloeaceae bacterium]|jgi:hypothetical protein|nr:hypothetical protein [Zoogloeaceae bacterium]
MSKNRLSYPYRGEGGWSIILSFVLVAFICLVATFWYYKKQKDGYDTEVKRLCAIDGGVKVYETVRLPPEKFDKRGLVNFDKAAQGENTLESEYIYKRENTYYRKGDPEIFRIGTKIIRRLDEKILAESAIYIRRGGDFPGTAHPSSFRCPLGPDEYLEKQVFINETSEGQAP